MKWIMVLGVGGLMVGSAEAGERWPDGPCADVAQVRVILERGDRTPTDKAVARLGVLLLQREHCGVSVKAELDADLATYQRAGGEADARTVRRRVQRPASEPRPTSEPRQPMNCTTIKIGDDMSSTNCF